MPHSKFPPGGNRLFKFPATLALMNDMNIVLVRPPMTRSLANHLRLDSRAATSDMLASNSKLLSSWINFFASQSFCHVLVPDVSAPKFFCKSWLRPSDLYVCVIKSFLTQKHPNFQNCTTLLGVAADVSRRKINNLLSCNYLCAKSPIKLHRKNSKIGTETVQFWSSFPASQHLDKVLPTSLPKLSHQRPQMNTKLQSSFDTITFLLTWHVRPHIHPVVYS